MESSQALTSANRLLFAVLILLFGLGTRFTFAADPPNSNCDGSPGHYAHSYPTIHCSLTNNPHFSPTVDADPCDRETRD